MKVPRRLIVGLFTALVIAVVGFFAWVGTPLDAAPEALSALESDSRVRVTIDEYVTFEPADVQPVTAFVFYPGGRVDYRAYSVPLRRIAEQGYLVILLPVRFNLAFFDISAADPAIAAHPEIRHWAVGGHSLGGVAAALYADRDENIDAVVFWASYPADETLKYSDKKVLSIYGTLDMGGMDSFETSRANLPASSKFVVLEGGNHSQFGDYGLQPGDNQAAITRMEQQSRVVEATILFLRSLSN
jgi:pimeloyl-ACP methyl ester carboxylesterase